jgi:hypothetical protein
MSDTFRSASSFRHTGPLAALIGVTVALAGISLRVLATGGELWLDEIWSLLKVHALSTPVEIVTKVKHDNNHLLNSLWMWLLGPVQSPQIYRAPSLIGSALLLMVLALKKPANETSRLWTIWLTLVAFSYPLTLYGTEARGYSLTLLCAAVAFMALNRLVTEPFDRRAVLTFATTGIVGCLSHAIYALFLAPSVAWLLWRVTRPPLASNSRAVLWLGIVPPVLFACVLTLTFYRNMEIGGAPLLPYLEVAASAISVSFGGETLSSIDPTVTGWNLFLGIGVILVCVTELVSWIRSGSPMAPLVALILITPWITVSVLQPHFILARYFIIQIFFAYLLAARFLDRLIRQGHVGTGVALLLLAGFIVGNTSRTFALAAFGRSHFVEIFETLVTRSDDAMPVTIGGDQDFQNGLRLSYTRILEPSTSRLTYVPNYRVATTPPRYIVRETLESYEVMPQDFSLSSGAQYEAIQRYRAPQLNGSHVTVYELRN